MYINKGVILIFAWLCCGIVAGAAINANERMDDYHVRDVQGLSSLLASSDQQAYARSKRFVEKEYRGFFFNSFIFSMIGGPVALLGASIMTGGFYDGLSWSASAPVLNKVP